MASTTTHLPTWLQQAMSAPGPSRVDFADSGYVSVFPDLRRYDSNISNWASPALWSTETSPLQPLTDASAGSDGQPLDRLHWTLTLQRVRQQPQSYDFQFRMVRLASWPALTHLPDEELTTVARICALLARKPTAASLIPLTLGLPEQQVFPLIEALRLNGHVQVSGGPAAAEDTPAAPPPVAGTDASGAATSSLIGKLWQRLGRRAQG